jgi:hypothetical protein
MITKYLWDDDYICFALSCKKFHEAYFPKTVVPVRYTWAIGQQPGRKSIGVARMGRILGYEYAWKYDERKFVLITSLDASRWGVLTGGTYDVLTVVPLSVL